jgi:protein-serine/threonine kinase
LIDSNHHVTLIDFGSSAYVSDGPFTTFFGTKLWAPPELLEGSSYQGKPQDMWQLGILLYTMLHKENPFYSVEDILQCEVPIRCEISDALRGLLLGLLCKNVDHRLTVKQALCHHWFQ